MAGHTVRETLAAFRRTPLLIGLSSTMIALSLFVVGLFGVAAYNINGTLDRVEARVEVVAYLRDGVSADVIRTTVREITAFPEVLEVQYISRAQALEIARRELPEFRALFADLAVNPLPASLEVRLEPGQRSPETVGAIADRIGAYPFVEEIAFGRDWLGKIYLLRRIAGAAALVLGSAFAAVAAIIIGAAIRMAIFARRDEIVIMRLVGATNGFVRRPFLLEGLLTGILGAGVAVALTYAAFRILSDAVFQLHWIPDTWVLGGVFAGGIMGIAASALAVHKHLREL